MNGNKLTSRFVNIQVSEVFPTYIFSVCSLLYSLEVSVRRYAVFLTYHTKTISLGLVVGEGVIDPQSVCQNEDPTAFPHCPAWILMISLGMILVVRESLFGSSCVDAVTLSKRPLGGVCVLHAPSACCAKRTLNPRRLPRNCQEQYINDHPRTKIISPCFSPVNELPLRENNSVIVATSP